MDVNACMQQEAHWRHRIGPSIGAATVRGHLMLFPEMYYYITLVVTLKKKLLLLPMGHVQRGSPLIPATTRM
jgi:hypothetical protein